MLRRFILVGLFVVGPAPRGSVMQLALAVAVCLAYQVLQAYANPYKSTSDDFLALLTSFMLTVFFLACLLLKFASLTAIRELQARMSIELVADFVLDTTVITVVLFVTVLGTICVSAVILAVQVNLEAARAQQKAREAKARRLLYRESGAFVTATSLGEARWHAFLSHVWSTGQDQMRIVKQRLLEMIPELKVFLDVDGVC